MLIFLSNILTSYACLLLLDFHSILCLIGKGVYYSVYYNECIDPQSGLSQGPNVYCILEAFRGFSLPLKIPALFCNQGHVFDPSII